MRSTRRFSTAVALCVSLAALLTTVAPAPAIASGAQLAIFADGSVYSDPQSAFANLRLLGVDMARINVYWSKIAPRPRSHRRPAGFHAADPGAYPRSNWSVYDEIVKYAQQSGLKVDFTLAGGLGAPFWADAPGAPRDKPHPEWKPSAREFGSFVRAVGTRYSGHYTPPGSASPLPRVSFWSVWNEPNFGEDLAPQAIRGSTVSVAPGVYRDLVDAAWSSLHATGHPNDTILIGELAPRGLSGPAGRRHPEGLPGNFAQTKPLQFIRTLYCVDSSYREYRRAAAAARGCPTTVSGSRAFRAAHPGLFQASGFSIHPYPENLPPTRERSSDPDYATFPELGRMERELDRLQRQYGSGTHFPIYNTEYGYITNPPNRGVRIAPATAAYYINWAEYLSWRSARIKSTMQYLLRDPRGGGLGIYSSGLERANGAHKPAYDAYRLPLYLPVTATRRGRNLEVWGNARPAHYAWLDSHHARQTVAIQFQRRSVGAFTTLRTLSIPEPSEGYFDLRVQFPTSGTARLAFTYPPSSTGGTVHSRSVKITLG
ncbi:MAG: hypothetical protein ACR2OB_00280 [Solirubrobacteraceae bacterium]